MYSVRMKIFCAMFFVSFGFCYCRYLDLAIFSISFSLAITTRFITTPFPLSVQFNLFFSLLFFRRSILQLSFDFAAFALRFVPAKTEWSIVCVCLECDCRVYTFFFFLCCCHFCDKNKTTTTFHGDVALAYTFMLIEIDEVHWASPFIVFIRDTVCLYSVISQFSSCSFVPIFLLIWLRQSIECNHNKQTK